jgi:hypothetical protein
MSFVQKAIERIETHSELKQLWEEGPDVAQWYAAIGDLRNRLGL